MAEPGTDSTEVGPTEAAHRDLPVTPPGATKSPRPNRVGKTIAGRYRVTKELGAGGMGIVYLAEHVDIGKEVALKVLSAALSERADHVERFLQEARAASRVRHPNVVDITDFGYAEDAVPFFAMELLDGEDLGATLAREGRLPWARVRDISLQILSALQAAHDKGVIHRDMKPDNCFRITRGDHRDFVKVLDFGIAKVLDDDEQHQTLTRTGAIIGTACYMSPEQAQGHKLDARTDVYSMGAILYQLLCGEVPFRDGGFMGVLASHITKPIPPMGEKAPGLELPAGVEAIVMKALAKDPERRWPSAAALSEALASIPAGAPAGPLGSRKLPWIVGGAGAIAVAVAATVFAGGFAWMSAGGNRAATAASEDASGDARGAEEMTESTSTGSPDRERLAAASAAFMEGSKHYELGDYARAIERFEAAWSITNQPDLLFNVAQAQVRWFEADGDPEHLRRARRSYENYDSRMRGSEGYDPAEIAERIASIDEQLAAKNETTPSTREPEVQPPKTPEAELPSKRRPSVATKPKESKEAPPAGLAAVPSPEAVDAALGKARTAALECGKKNGGLPGMTVKVAYEIQPGGRAKAAAQRPMGGTALGRCAEQAIEAQSFGPSTDGARGSATFTVG